MGLVPLLGELQLVFVCVRVGGGWCVCGSVRVALHTSNLAALLIIDTLTPSHTSGHVCWAKQGLLLVMRWWYLYRVAEIHETTEIRLHKQCQHCGDTMRPLFSIFLTANIWPCNH